MTKLYIYCLFDRFDNFLGVYSSLKAIHRDALVVCNQGSTRIYMQAGDRKTPASLVDLRNTFKGVCDVEVKYFSDRQMVKIFKTKIKE